MSKTSSGTNSGAQFNFMELFLLQQMFGRAKNSEVMGWTPARYWTFSINTGVE